jgi:hypothetical protein
MKNKFKILLIVLISLFVSNSYVIAKENDTTVTIDWLQNIYANRKVGNGHIWNQLGIIKANGKVSYCLEPNQFITESIYDSTDDFKVKGINDKDKEYLELLAYYGYNYKNHTDVNYYMASQELIWEHVSSYDIFWTTGAKVTGDTINIDSYKNEILELVKNHDKKPSYDGNNYVGKEGINMSLSDNNRVINDFEVKNDSNVKIDYDDNRIIIYGNKVSNHEVILVKKKQSNDVSIIYTKGNSQTIASFNVSKEVISKFKYRIDPIDVNFKVYKKDKNTDSVIKGKKFSFKVKDLSNDNYIENGKVFTTNDDGYFELNHLGKGNYKIIEVQSDGDYYLNSNGLSFKVDGFTPRNNTINFYDEPLESRIIINKTGDDLSSFENDEFIYIKKPLTGVIYQVYAEEDIKKDDVIYYKKGDLVDEVTTINGQALTKLLPDGKYYVIEKLTILDYIKDDNCYTISLNKETKKLNFHNNKIKGKLTIIKYGSDNKLLSNVVFGLYADSDIKNSDGNTIFSKDQLIKKVITKDGYVVIDNLPNANYYIKELETTNDYTLNNSKYSFKIDLNNKDVKIKIINDKKDDSSKHVSYPKTSDTDKGLKKIVTTLLFVMLISYMFVIVTYEKD